MTGNPIVAWTACFAQTNGQAIVTKKVVEYLSTRTIVLCTTYEPGIRGILTVLRGWFIVSFNLYRRAPFCFYIVPSRSVGGLFRDLVPLAVARVCKVKTFAHLHGNDLDLLNKPFISLVCGFLYKKVVFISPVANVRRPAFLLKNDLVLIENFVRNSRLVPISNLPNLNAAEGKEKKCVYISNLIFSKGFLSFILAAHHISRFRFLEYGRFKFEIYGSLRADEYASVKSLKNVLVIEKKRNPNMVFSKIDSDEAYLSVISSANILCLPTFYRTELAPIAIIEAMCNGLAIVCTDIPILRLLCEGYPYVRFTTASPTSIAWGILNASVRDVAEAEMTVSAIRSRFSEKRFERSISRLFLNIPE